MLVLYATTLENWFSEAYDQRLEPERRLNSKWMFYFAFGNFFYKMKEALILKIFLYFAGGVFVISKSISIGQLIMFISYMESMDIALDTLLQSKTDFQGQKAAFGRIFQNFG